MQVREESPQQMGDNSRDIGCVLAEWPSTWRWPSGQMETIVRFIVTVNCPMWFNIKVKHSWLDGPCHILSQLILKSSVWDVGRCKSCKLWSAARTSLKETLLCPPSSRSGGGISWGEISQGHGSYLCWMSEQPSWRSWSAGREQRSQFWLVISPRLSWSSSETLQRMCPTTSCIHKVLKVQWRRWLKQLRLFMGLRGGIGL